MVMKKINEQLFDSITNIDDELIQESLENRITKRQVHWKPLLAAAACAGVFLIGSAIFFTQNHNHSPADGTASSKNTSYQAYAGPLLPLTMTENDPEIQAVRNTTLDLSVYNSDETYDYHADVSDQYQMINTGETSKTVEFLYPFTGSYNKLFELLPHITSGRQIVSTEILAGNYIGSFTSDEGACNLKYPESWKDYDKLLEDGTYIKQLFSQAPDMNIPVIIYQFNEKPVKPAQNKDLVVNVKFNHENTQILSYGFNGLTFPDDKNHRIYSATLPDKERTDIATPRLIVIGDDIISCTTNKRDNKTGKTNYANPKNISCEETTLGAVLKTITTDYAKIMDMMYESNLDSSAEELFYRSFIAYVEEYGILANQMSPRYFDNQMETMLSDVFNQDRIFYLKFTLELLPDTETALEITLPKPYSHNFSCTKNKKQTHGYDMLTQTGSNLTFTEQHVSITNAKHINIQSQNFGFDLTNNILSVPLDQTKKHYYLDIE